MCGRSNPNEHVVSGGKVLVLRVMHHGKLFLPFNSDMSEMKCFRQMGIRIKALTANDVSFEELSQLSNLPPQA